MRWRALAQLITALRRPDVDAAAGAQGLRARPLQEGAGGGHHRHRRRRQVVADRRADPPLAAWTRTTALRVAVISIDPSRRKSGGALLGDRIRMNAHRRRGRHGRCHAVFMRSLATRDFGTEISRGPARRDCRLQGWRAST